MEEGEAGTVEAATGVLLGVARAGVAGVLGALGICAAAAAGSTNKHLMSQ